MKIIFKSPIEYKIAGFCGSPCYYIHKIEDRTYTISALNTTTMKHQIMERSYDFSLLHDKALRLSNEIEEYLRDKGQSISEKRDTIIENLLKGQIESAFK